jgi:hypothetical protein
MFAKLSHPTYERWVLVPDDQLNLSDIRIAEGYFRKGKSGIYHKFGDNATTLTFIKDPPQEPSP